jgi:outer membrane protein TolC
MKTISISLFLAATLTAGFAQTNLPAARPLTLQDCFVEALKHNFDVRIQEFNPQISEFNLRLTYGGYDPTFSFEGLHQDTRQGATIQSDGSYTLPTTSQNNTFTPDLNGSTPWGMTYDLAGNISENHLTKSYNAKNFNTNVFLPDNSSGSVGLTLQQNLLKNFWIDNTRLSISAAKNQLKISEQGLRLQLITTATAVEDAYYELIYARENLKVQQEALVLAQQQLSDDQTRVKIGTIAESGGTIEQDESQVAQNRANLIAAQYTLATDENALKNLITDNYQQWHDVDIEPMATLTAQREFLNLQESWSKGMEKRPELQQAKLNLAQQGIQVKYDYNQLFPTVQLIGSYGLNGAGYEYKDTFNQIGDSTSPFYSYGGNISMPLSNVSARNQIKSDKVTEQQLMLKLKQLEQNIMVDIDNAVKQAQSAWESVDATQKARIYADAALKAEQGKYAVGKSTTFTVLQLQNNLTSARSQEIRALANYNEALANLSQQEGSTLERDKLDLTVK